MAEKRIIKWILIFTAAAISAAYTYLIWVGEARGAALPAGGKTVEDPAVPSADATQAEAVRTVTDMAGRKVRIPVTITKALSTSPPPTTFIYMLAPEKLGAWTGAITKENGRFIPEKYHDKTVIRWGRGHTNYEAYIAARPDLIFVGFETGSTLSQVALTQEKFGDIPVVCVENSRNAVGYAETIRFMGEVLGVPDRAQALIDYYQNVLEEVQSKVALIPDAERVRVYYAEEEDGLSTDPEGSVHSQLIDVCGGINVAECAVSSGSGKTAVTMESVLVWQPEVIITTSGTFASTAPGDASWDKISAVRNGRIYLTPSRPFNWFDRPPGVNRIVGIPWTAHVLYPEIFTASWFRTKAKTFYDLFYHYDLSDEELAGLLEGNP